MGFGTIKMWSALGPVAALSSKKGNLHPSLYVFFLFDSIYNACSPRGMAFAICTIFLLARPLLAIFPFNVWDSQCLT